MMKDALKYFQEMVKSLPFLRYAYPILAVILILSLAGNLNLSAWEVFVATPVLILLAFICFFFFKVLPGERDPFILRLRNIFAAFLILLAMATLILSVSYAVKQFFFPESESTESAEQIHESSIIEGVIRFGVRVDSLVPKKIIITPDNMDGKAHMDENGRVELTFRRLPNIDTIAIGFRADNLDVVNTYALRSIPKRIYLKGRVLPPPKRADLKAPSVVKRFPNSSFVVETLTADEEDASTDERIDIELQGSEGILTRRLNNSGNDFERGRPNAFTVTLNQDIGELTKVILKLSNSKPGTGIGDWKIKSLTIRDKNRSIVYTKELGEWLGNTQTRKRSLEITSLEVYKSATIKNE